jgi:hypothetical protein
MTVVCPNCYRVFHPAKGSTKTMIRSQGGHGRSWILLVDGLEKHRCTLADE